MKDSKQERINQLIRFADKKGYRTYKDYSGRGMMGATTTAIIVPSLGSVPNYITGYSWDNFGHEYIIYYK